MNLARPDLRRRCNTGINLGMWSLLALAGAISANLNAQQPAQDTPAAQQPATTPAPNPDSQLVGDTPAQGVAPAEDATPEGRERAAWKLLTDAMADAKHPQTRIQALAALGLLRSAKSEKILADAMADPDVDVRTGAILAAGQAKDRNLTTNVRDLLDDKEPQVAFTAATTLWKMGDKSGEDILISVVDGERSASASLMHGTGHKISRDLHDPAALARLGALQGAAMALGPFGFGITAFEYIHQNGGDLARVSAIEQISQERTEPVHQKLIAALTDKDQTVRAAAAKALVDYHDKATSMAVYALLVDPKQPVRLTSAAAYLRTTGTPGPELEKPVQETPVPRKPRRLTTPSSTKPVAPVH
jgi:HEAT repeat protein